MLHPLYEAALRELERKPPHNVRLEDGQLAKAAAAVLLVDPALWPWDGSLPTTGTRRQDLVRATALIIEEWDRLEQRGNEG